MTLHQDTSLLRKSSSTLLSIFDTTSTWLSLSRTFPGSFFAAGLPLVLRGYWRLASGEGTATCNIKITMTGVNTSLFLSRHVSSQANGTMGTPWELSTLTLALSCNTSSPGVVVDWAALGLLPNPDVACKCPRGFYYEIQDGACVRCAAGSYCIAGMKRQCPDGTFSFGKAASCESCRDGWICTDGLARLCDPGTYSTPSFTCGICPSGYACQNGKKLVCPAGTFSLTKANRLSVSSVRWGGLPTISATTAYRVRLVKQRFTLDNIPAHLVLLLPSQSTINLRFASHNVGRSNNLRPQDHAGIHDYAS
ncbi:Hypothetical protein PHPALM_9766 [Phytophthora palmivora]|uniref:Tyrosine-protein kinase ephrin type A/B receptor-like domain-containing protein n=1 Tax=Phytophthora palmivora TaxID=4796 RepID=A0A2P4Y6T0_9STRA|nr:Hypothetical protein PHPALM_9766 [Phytophthora palmivora]